jgi:UDP-N-acetylglucosamine--N-acetylmuramyl-(pentapeptide) pyrophosphoryl-undecaprenol N-acetylglucosamine transferase
MQPTPHSTDSLRVVIAAGGTGGHIYPGIATADAIRALVPDAEITFSGTTRGLETTLVPKAGYRLDTVPMKPFARCDDAHLIAFPFHLARSVRLAAKQLRRDHVDVVVGMGGYPSVPAVLAARLLGIPCVLHESNAVPGRANALAARVTRHIATGFDPAGARWCRGREVRYLGIPLDPRLADLDARASRQRARRHFGLSEGQRFLVVSGGSQGANSLNTVAAALAARWGERLDVRFLIKARAGDAERLRGELLATGADRVADVVDFIDRMDLAYAAADVAILRSGSATVAELQHLGTPAVLVPYPHAPGDHQTHNARALVQTGQARLVADDALGVDSLERAVDDLLRAGVRSRPGPSRHADAAEALARWAIDLAASRRPSLTTRHSSPLRKVAS